MNTEKMKAVRDHILVKPNRLHMECCIVKQSVFQPEVIGKYDCPAWARGVKAQPFAECGTAGCIAGWAAMLFAPEKLGTNEILEIGQEVLELTLDQYHRLFFVSGWPTKFAARYGKAKTPRGLANAAAVRINYMIETGK